MLSIENPPPDLPSQQNTNSSCSSNIHDQQSSGVLHSDLLISCPKFTIRDYAFSNRSKDIETSWPFSEKSLQLCMNHGVKDLLPPFQSLDAEKTPTPERCTIATSLVSKENEYHLIDQASRPTNHLFSFTSDAARPSLTSVHSSPTKSQGVRIFSSMVVEAETCLKISASKPFKKLALVANKVENIMKPLTKTCREIVKLNNPAADQNKMENNTSTTFFVSETMASKVCPVCKTFTSSSNTTLNAHIDQCLSGQSISEWTSDAKVTKSRIKPRRMRSMFEIYETSQHCTIEELERRNGINLSSCSSLPAQDMEVGSVERKRKSPVDFEETENEGAVYVDGKGKKLRILSKLNDLSSLVLAGDDTGARRHIDGYKNCKLSLAKRKKKPQEKHHKLHIRVSDNNKLCSLRHHQNSQINDIQEHTSGPEEHLEVEEAFAKQSTNVQVKYINPKSVGRRACSKRSVLTKTNDKDDLQHPTWTRKRKLAGVNNGESPPYSYVNGGCGSKRKKSSGAPPASPRSSDPHDDYGRVFSLRKSVRVPLGSEPCYDKNNPLGDGNQKESRESDSSVKCKIKDGLRNKLIPMDVLSIRKVKVKRALTIKSSSVGHNLKHILNGHDLSSKSREFSYFTKNKASRLPNPQASACQSTFGSKHKRLDLKRPHAYCGSEPDGQETVLKSVTKTSDNVSLDRRVFKVRRDGGTIKVSGKGEISASMGMKSTSMHRQQPIDGTHDSYSDNVTVGSHDENESAQNNVQPCEKDVVDEATCSNPFYKASKRLCKSSDVQCHKVSGYINVLSDSRGYMKFCDGPSLETEDARYPVEAILNGGEKMLYVDEDGTSILGQNGHTTTELHSNDDSGSYYAEVDLIPIPGPPGSFLPSPSSGEFHGNSTPTSSRDESSENHHEFADRHSSDSPSPTSTISNSDIATFDSSLNVKLPFRHSIQEVMKSDVSDATDGTMVDKISLDPSAGEGVYPVESEVHLSYYQTAAPLGLKSAQPCCYQKDGAVFSSDFLNYQDTSLLSWPTMPAVPEYHFSALVNSENSRRAKNLNFNVPSSERLAGGFHNDSSDPLGLIADKASNDSGIKIFNTDGESASPSTSNHVLRLMGKDLMVVNKEETCHPHQTAKEIIVIDDSSESSVDLVTDPIQGMSFMSRRRPAISPPLTTSRVSPRNSNFMYGYEPKTSHSGSLPLELTASFKEPPMMAVNSMSIKWNCVNQGSTLISRGSFPISTSAAHPHMRSRASQSGGFS